MLLTRLICKHRSRQMILVIDSDDGVRVEGRNFDVCDSCGKRFFVQGIGYPSKSGLRKQSQVIFEEVVQGRGLMNKFLSNDLGSWWHTEFRDNIAYALLSGGEDAARNYAEITLSELQA